MVEVYFDDLTKEAQKQILEQAGITNPAEANWDVFPMCTFEIDPDDDNDPDNGNDYDPEHAEEWMKRHPNGWYNNENDKGTGDED